MTAPIRVLYVDDNPFDRDLVRDALTATDKDFAVTETTNRSELEAALEPGRFDCVLSDLNILGYSGLDVYEAVLTRAPDLPVVILTGTGSEEFAVDAMKRGISDYILKTPKHIQRLPYSLAAAVEKAHFAAERRRAESELRVAAEVFQASREGIMVTDSECRLTMVNPAFTRMTGYSSDEVRGRNPSLLKSGRHDAAFFRLMWDSLRRNGYWQGSIWNSRKDGTPWPAWLSITMVRDEAGNVMHYTGVLTDMTERWQASERIRELAERISLATRAAGIGIWDFEPETGALSWDDTLCRLYGVDPATLTGSLSDWRSRLHPDDLAATETGFFAAAATGSAWESEFRILRPDGAVRAVRSQATFLSQSGGRPSRLLGVTWDISDYRNAVDAAEVARAAAESANRAKGRFLANISHELWTPMNSIIGFSEVILSTETDTERREHLELILRAGRSLLRIFQDVLAISRSDTEPFNLNPVPFDLREEIEYAASLFRAEAIRKGLGFTVINAPDVPRQLRGDRILLRQILVTLLSNAVKFTDRGSVSLEVTVAGAGTRAPSAEITFRITDTGVGIRPENQARVFEPFEQEDNSTVRRFDGTGLGLSIARKLVRRLGGSIGFSSEPGVGSSFHFTVRFEVPEIDADTAKPSGFS
ncbi:MAG: PAS domain-containing protein [Rhodospirillaceae bacterium]